MINSKLTSIAVIPAVFVIAFLAAFIAMGAADALAQPAEPTEAAEPTERPAHGFAEPNDGPPDGLTEQVAGTDVHGDASGPAGVDDHGADAHGGGHGDPSKHFNFFGMDYRGKDVMGGRYGDGVMIDPATGEKTAMEEAMSAPFILMVVNFLILLGIVVWKGGPAATKLAVERHDQIKNALDEAAKLRQQAQDKLTEYETRLKDADAEIKKMVEGMRTDAEADKARILDNAAKQSALMKREAEQRIAAEIELARATLTREVTAAAATATEKLLREKLMPADQSKLVATFITDVQAAPQLKERV